MGQLEIEAVVAARAKPLRVQAAIALSGSEIELHRQLEVVHALVIAEQQVQLTQGGAVLANWQIGCKQLNVRRLGQCVLP